MSATDSDSSIDWLESDHEEVSETESPQEENRRDMKQDKQALDRDTQPWDRQATGRCNKPCHSPPQALKRQHSSHSSQDDRQLTPSVSEAEQLFSRKCTELQCYIHPLSLILNGLRSGRYRERLSSFQESVAMDRIQRIMGVLQNPCMGEKYMNIILKMEEMLKSWFPNVRLPEQPPTSQTEEPVHSKKAKLCSSAPMGPFTSTEPAVGPKALRVTDLTPPGAYSASNMKWLHTSPICSPTAEQSQGPRAPQSPKDTDLTQDSVVSSSTDCPTKTEPAPRGPPPGKINAPCLERLLKSTESIITRRGPGPGGLMDSSSS